MPTSFYDTVVLGMSLEPLLCAALLARAGLRVLVVGQKTPEPSYMLEQVEIEIPGTLITGAKSPIVQATLEDLALKQDVRQRMIGRSNALQLLLPGHRMNVYPDTARWLDEIERELPSTRRQAEDITRTLIAARDKLDTIIHRNHISPPRTFSQRQRTLLRASFRRNEHERLSWTSWNHLPIRHPLHTAFEAVLPHCSGLFPAQHSDFTRARLHSQILTGVDELTGSARWLRQALCDRIQLWGGDVKPRDRADLIYPLGSRRHGIRLGRIDQEIGCSQVVYGRPIHNLVQLLPKRLSRSALFEQVGNPHPRAYRCSVHVLVLRRAVPEELSPIALLCMSTTDPSQSYLLRTRDVGSTKTLLSASCIVDAHRMGTPSVPLRQVRKTTLDAVRSVVPFLDEHMVWMDSFHDGLPPHSFVEGRGLAPNDPWSRGPQAMEAIYEYPVRSAHGVCALPTRLPLRGLFLCNQQVAPGLGFEGAIIAAASTAKSIKSQYKMRHQLRRSPWAPHTA